MGSPPRKGPGGKRYSHPPAQPRGIPGLFKVKPKTRRQGAAKRLRYKDADGNIYEWDSQHGAYEKYNSRGDHLGEYAPDTGEQLKPPDPTRKVEP